MKLDSHVFRPRAAPSAGCPTPRNGLRARSHSQCFRSCMQLHVARLAGFDSIRKRDIDSRRKRHVLRDVHALAPAPPPVHLLGRSPKRLRRLSLVPPPEEAECGFEQGHCAELLLPSRFLSFRRSRELFGVGDRARVGVHGSLQVLERDLQKRGNTHHFVEWRPSHAAELPALDRACADADDLPELRPRVASCLAALLKESGNGCLLDGHGAPVRCLRINRYRSIRGFPRISWTRTPRDSLAPGPPHVLAGGG